MDPELDTNSKLCVEQTYYSHRDLTIQIELVQETMCVQTTLIRIHQIGKYRKPTEVTTELTF